MFVIVAVFVIMRYGSDYILLAVELLVYEPYIPYRIIISRRCEKAD